MEPFPLFSKIYICRKLNWPYWRSTALFRFPLTNSLLPILISNQGERRLPQELEVYHSHSQSTCVCTLSSRANKVAVSSLPTRIQRSSHQTEFRRKGSPKARAKLMEIEEPKLGAATFTSHDITFTSFIYTLFTSLLSCVHILRKQCSDLLRDPNKSKPCFHLTWSSYGSN